MPSPQSIMATSSITKVALALVAVVVVASAAVHVRTSCVVQVCILHSPLSNDFKH